MDESKGFSVTDIKNIIRRRIKIFLAVSIPIFIIAVAVTFILPPVYVSKSTILIESQQIPAEYVKSTVEGYVEERLQATTQQIMVRAKLLEIMNQFNLYPDLREKYGNDVAIEKIRKDINLQTIRSGKSRSDKTVAFTLSYEGKDPPTVQRVANVLASLYLEENLKRRSEQATRTTDFLQKELDQFKRRINDYEVKIIEFKESHFGELPENAVNNARAIDQLRRDLDQLNMQVLSLKERKIYMEGQLANLDSSVPIVTEDGRSTSSSPGERLQALRLQLIGLQSSLSQKHPDIIKLRGEIEELEAQTGGRGESGGKEEKMKELQTKLASTKAKLGPKHPDVIKLSKEIESLSQVENSSDERTKKSLNSFQHYSNPAYVALKTQIESTAVEMNVLLQERENIKKRIDQYQKKIEKAPLIEKQYSNLVTDYEHVKTKYNEIMSKQLEAQVAKEMESTQHGERFTLIEPAQEPAVPEKPNRLKMLLMSIFLSIGAGVGLAALLESMDHSIKSAGELKGFLNVPVLSVIPLMESDEEKRCRRRKILIFGLTILSAVSLAVLAVHFFLIPLDILLLKIQRKMMLTL